MSHTLAVDSRLRPLGLIPVEEAVSRIACDLVEGTRRVVTLVSDETRRFRSKHLDIAAPLVVQWPGYVEVSEHEARHVSRRVLFARDGFTCQYCGYVARATRATRELTVDHVKPAHLFPSRALATTWDNVTTACLPCNHKKGGDLPMECGMWPAQTPKEPSFVQLKFGPSLHRLHPAQRDYVKSYFALGDDLV